MQPCRGPCLAKEDACLLKMCPTYRYGAPGSLSAKAINFKQGAGAIDVWECAGETNLNAHPEAFLPMFALEHLMKTTTRVGEMPPMPFPAEPIQLLFSTAETAKTSTLVATPQIW